MALLWGRGPSLRGKERWSVTTALHIDQERELIRLAKTVARFVGGSAAGADRPRRERFVARNPAVDPAGGQWQGTASDDDQARHRRPAGGGDRRCRRRQEHRARPVVEAWKADGREVFGITLGWRRRPICRSAGIVERASVAAFLKRVETGRYILDRNSVVVVDEVGLSAPAKCSICCGCKKEPACRSSWSAIRSNASRSRPGRSSTCCARRLAKRPFRRS